MSIRAIDAHSVHHITSGQVVVDVQTAVKELVENSLDAGATSIEVRFQNHGLKAIEVVDNGCGIAPKDHDSIALKHYTSKLASFDDLARVLTFGFRGEALSSLCALSDGCTVTTATADEAPMGTVIDMDRNGKVRSKSKIARQRGTTVAVSSLFKSLPVRRKELERNTKREFQKALNLLYAYAVVPCTLENKGVRLTVSNQSEGGRKVVQFKTDGSPSIRASVLAVWGPRALENIVDLDLAFNVEAEKSIQKRIDPDGDVSFVTPVKVHGLISKFTVGAGRSSSDRQFFFVNGRPYNPGKVQKAVNEIYRTFNANQSPFVIADIIIPTNACDINISPDKRTIFLHSENNLVQALKTALETTFSSARSTYDVIAQPQVTQQSKNQAQTCGLEKRETRPRHRLASPVEDAPPRLVRPDDANGTGGRNGQDFLLGDGPDEERVQSEPEPEPTLVAQPGPSDKNENDQGGDHGAKKAQADRIIDYPRNRAPSEPLFFPDSDDDEGTSRQVGNSEKKNVQDERRSDKSVCSAQALRSTTIATSSAASPSAVPLAHIAQSPTNVVDKPRSVQTVLSTRGAAWNVRKNDDGGTVSGGKRKRPRLSDENDRVRANKKRFRSSLSQFSSSGSKPLPVECESESERSDEVDELLDDEEEAGQCLVKKKSKGGSDSSQVTVIVLSDDENVIDVDEPQASRAPISAGDVAEDIESRDDWTFSSTLVGTYAPSANKTIEQSSKSTSSRTPPEADTSFVTLHINLVSIGSYYLDAYQRLASSSESSPLASTQAGSSTVRSAISSANLETAAEDTVASAALSRIISKSDFQHMSVVGQFNLGFIIVRKREQGEGMDDLFIVDQHAADEKWNFETLQAKTVIASQKLFRPQRLQLTAADEMLAIENMDMLKLNGFELEQVEEQEICRDGDEPEAEGVRVRLQLVAQPMSKDTVFDIKDLEELIHLMQDRPKGTMVRCSKARAMFAMRACRRSVMIGKALDKTRMTTIVRHMGTMDLPWNCPHGRPTMRHLSDMTTFEGYERRRTIDWEAYGIDACVP